MKATPMGPELKLLVDFNRATKLLFIDSIPTCMTQDRVIDCVLREFTAFGRIRFIDVVTKKRAVFISFHDIYEATQAVRALRGKVIASWEWEIEFHKV